MSLGVDDYQRVLAVLEGSGRAVTLAGFAEAVLEGLQREFGYGGCNLMIAEPSPDGPIAVDGAMRGAPDRMDEYFERWRDKEAFEDPAARALIARHGVARLHDFFDRLERPRKRFCTDFLAPSAIRDQLAAHIDTGFTRQGFVSVLADEREQLSERDRALLIALRPHLANQLRALLSVQPEAELRPMAGREPLTRRQHEVAELAARGLGNAEIAAALAISEPTAKKHLAEAFRRLGVSSRAQLAARSVELGLRADSTA